MRKLNEITNEEALKVASFFGINEGVIDRYDTCVFIEDQRTKESVNINFENEDIVFYENVETFDCNGFHAHIKDVYRAMEYIYSIGIKLSFA